MQNIYFVAKMEETYNLLIHYEFSQTTKTITKYSIPWYSHKIIFSIHTWERIIDWDKFNLVISSFLVSILYLTSPMRRVF